MVKMSFNPNEINAKAGCCTKISKFFHWKTFRFMRKITKNDMTDNDIESIGECEMSEKLGLDLERQWERELQKAKMKPGYTPSLCKAIVRMFALRYALAGLFIFFGIAMRLCQPILLVKLTQYYMPEYNISKVEANINAVLLVLTVVLRIIFQSIYGDMTRTTGMRIRVACSYLIFKKMLEKRAGSCSQQHPLTLLNNDVHKFDLAMEELHWLWACPLHLVLSCIMMYVVVGLPTLVSAITVFIVFFSLQLLLGKVLVRQRKAVSEMTDKRVRLMTDVISGIKLIKFYAWEEHFERLVADARRMEFSEIKKAAAIRGFLSSFIGFFDRGQVFFVLLAHTLFQKSILSYQIIALYSLFNQTKYGLTSHFPAAITMGAECKSSVRRIQAYLTENIYAVRGTLVQMTSDHPGQVKMENASAAWVSDRPVVSNISLDLKAGQLCAVIGPVGAGKSSLLHVLMGELPLSSGSAALGGSVSYASQVPWIFRGTVRDNILFGETFNSHRYEQVLRVCALKTDIDRMPNGDLSVVGDRGQTLSGGQRARVNLARAIYKDADIYILDDPLSAVDAHVSKILFQECICSFLKSKTCLLITHQVYTLPHCDHVIIIDEGAVKIQGTFQDIQNSGIFYQSLLSGTSCENEEDTHSTEKGNNVQKLNEAEKNSKCSDIQIENTKQYYKSIWRYFTKSGGVCGVIIMIICMIAAQATINVINVYVSHWADLESSQNISNSTRLEYLEIVGGVLLISVSVTFIRTAYVFKNLLSSSYLLHNSMLESVLRTYIQFFHSTPSGTILSHFTSSIGVLDEQLPTTILWVSQMVLLIVCNYIVMTIFRYECAFSFIIMVILIAWIARITIISIRQVKKFEGLRKSKSIDFISDTLNGLTTIRALGKVKQAHNQFSSYQDTYSSAKLMHVKMCITQTFYLSSLTAIIIALNINIFTNIPGSISTPAFMGLGLYYATSLEYGLPVLVVHFGQMLSHFPSIPHIISFGNLTHETEIENHEANTSNIITNSSAVISFSDAYLRYSESGEPILKGISFDINEGEKIGIVGRTGAGKSSLITALLRLVPNQREGVVQLHSRNICAIPLSLLRKSITIVPQEPVFFLGTLRSNLDPSGTIDDAKLWEALKSVDLDDQLMALDTEVKEGGRNWSQGQKQLISLARAYLRNSEVLVFDEATASLDNSTDAAIQETIRHLFKDCTVLVIAHRLNTVIDYDRILVMDSGAIVEFDHPYKLLSNKKSSFYSLVQSTGKDSVDNLTHLAKQAYLKKINGQNVLMEAAH